MTIPTHISPANSFNAARTKINTLIDHVDSLDGGQPKNVSWFEEFGTSSASDWDLFGTSPGSISATALGYTTEQSGTTSSGYYTATLNGNQAPGTYMGSAYSKKEFDIGSSVGSGWEFHFRVGANWNSVADSPIARTFTIGIINTNSHPVAHASMASHVESYYFSFVKTSNGNTSAMGVTLEKGSGGNPWSVSNIASFVTFTQAAAASAPNPWYVLSFRYTTDLLQAFVNGVLVSQVVTPFVFGTSETVKIGSNHGITIGSAVPGSLMSFRTDYVSVLGRNVRAFTELP